MATAVEIGDAKSLAPEVSASWDDSWLGEPLQVAEAGFVPEVISFHSPVSRPAAPPVVTMAESDEEADDEDVEGVETPDFEGLEEFDDEDFDDEFDDDFEEELEDEYDFDEFDERVTEEDLEAAEVELPLAGDFVDEDAEEEPVEAADPELDPKKEPEEKPKRVRKKGKDDDAG